MRPLHALAALMIVTSASRFASAQDPAPLVVLTLPGDDLPEGAAGVITEASRTRLGESVRGRATVAINDEAATAAGLACSDAPCLGAVVTRSGGVAAVVIRVQRPAPRGPLAVTLELVSAASGEALAPASTLEVPEETALSAELFLALAGGRLDAFARRVAPPPVRARLLVAVNIEGAAVTVDGEAVGEAPVAAIEVAPGDHTVAVTARGFQPFNRSVAVTEQGARVNALLEPSEDAARQMAADDDARDQAFGAAAPAEKEWHQKWWVWAAIGGGALVLAGVITAVAIAAGGDEGPQPFLVPTIPGGT